MSGSTKLSQTERDDPNLLGKENVWHISTAFDCFNVSFFCSNNPYSEPDADNSPNNDTDWDWGGGKASPCGSPGPNVDPDHQNAALTKTVLTGEDNAVSKCTSFFCCPLDYFDLMSINPVSFL